MYKEKKYEYRKDKKPYTFSEPVSENPNVRTGVMPGVSYKMFEIFDGNEVKWGIRESYISIYMDYICKSTPLFENMTDENGKDLERIIYLGNSKFVYHGKINGSEVLCKINGSSEESFYTIEDFYGNNVKIQEKNDGIVFVTFKLDGLDKCVYFNCHTFSKCSNEFDAIDEEGYFLKNYVINGKMRRFMGQIDLDTFMVKPYGYDINKNEYIIFPTDDKGLIDDDIMMDLVVKTLDIGNDLDSYKISNFLRNSAINLGLYRLDKKIILDELNNGRIR